MRAFLIASAALFAATAVSAEPAGTLVIKADRVLADNQRAVAYGDLQLASAEGRAALRNRVGLAIDSLCDPKRFSVAEPTDANKCAAQAWAEVTPRLNELSPRLAAR
jgi:UrcA family protein